MPNSGNLWNMIGFGCPTAFILNNFKNTRKVKANVHTNEID